MSSELLETEYILSKYQEIRAISESDKNNIILVMESRTNKLYVKKVFPKSINLDAYILASGNIYQRLSRLF